ncbi:4-dihydrotrisporin dehydrogenase [Phycomyces blakesleeanus]|uniref:4-dihydrotrisporin dehydrogenase n=1 Tax=Phycomyces blakesleeanus TaxID=4837 RepID=A0ABR3AMB3_PHYBL
MASKVLNYLITGTSRGLGLEMVKQLSDKGHLVVACARKPDDSEALQELVDNKSVYAIQMDIVSPSSVKAAIENIGKIVPQGIDVLINNAGNHGIKGLSIEEIPPEDFMYVFETNVVGTSNVTQAALPLLKRRSTRQIVNVTSALGSLSLATTGTVVSYRVAKAAENMLTRTWAAHLKKEDFTVVSLHPGWARTDLGGPNAPLSAEQAINGVLTCLEKLEPKNNGVFLDYRDKNVQW